MLALPRDGASQAFFETANIFLTIFEDFSNHFLSATPSIG